MKMSDNEVDGNVADIEDCEIETEYGTAMSNMGSDEGEPEVPDIHDIPESPPRDNYAQEAEESTFRLDVEAIRDALCSPEIKKLFKALHINIEPMERPVPRRVRVLDTSPWVNMGGCKVPKLRNKAWRASMKMRTVKCQTDMKLALPSAEAPDLVCICYESEGQYLSS